MLNCYRNIIINGITLIALVVTIVILLILAGITISLVFGPNGVVKKAQEAANKTNEAVINEQAQMNSVTSTIENMLNGIGGGSTTPEEPLPEGAVQFSPVEWENGKASTMITTSEEGYTLQYQIGGIAEENWIDTTSGYEITDLTLGQTVYGRLFNGTEGSKTANITVEDLIKPNAQISLSGTSVETTGSITATVTFTDNESGLNIIGSKWDYNTNAGEMGEEVGSYQNSFTNDDNPQTITLSTTTAGTYYLHVLTVDNAGNKIETISSPITIIQDYNSKIKEGDYINYSSGNYSGNWIILYKNNNSSAGNGENIQIISEDIVKNVEIGEDTGNTETVGELYNTAITKLNKEAENYINTTYAIDARCVGSVPNNKNAEALNNFSSNYSFMERYNGKFKDSDTNYEIDYEQMKKLNIVNLNTKYWLASRTVLIDGRGASFNIYKIDQNGELSNSTIISIQSDGGAGNKFSNGLRPVVSLKSNINIIGGDGSKENPWKLDMSMGRRLLTT